MTWLLVFSPFLVSQVVAPGGCTLQSSRLDLLPCLCGGGGTIFSRVHRRLVVANRLSSIIAAAAAASPPRGAEEKKHYSDLEKSRKKRREGDAWEPTAGPETAEPAKTPLETPSAEGRSTAPASGLDALAMLSVQPTPLPVPLYAPTITLAVEAAVVAFGGSGGGANADMAQPETATAKPVQEETRISKEPKVVVGSLLLHGGTRGATRRALAATSFFLSSALRHFPAVSVLCVVAARFYCVSIHPVAHDVDYIFRICRRSVPVAALQVRLSTYLHPSTCMQQRAVFA